MTQPPDTDQGLSELLLPCPICNGVEGCDHTVPERLRAFLTQHKADRARIAELEVALKEARWFVKADGLGKGGMGEEALRVLAVIDAALAPAPKEEG